MTNQFSFLFYFLIPFTLFAQNTPTNHYDRFDEIVGSVSNNLTQGLRFVDAYNRSHSVNDFRFFESKSFTSGFLSYNGEPYFDCNIKYDLLEDNIIFKNTTGQKNFEIILNALHLDAFTIYGKTFVKLPEPASQFSFYNNGFFERIYQGQDFNIYVKHQKFRKKRLGDTSVSYEFLSSENLVLEYDSEFYELTSKNSIIKVFPEKKEMIKSFYDQNKVLKSQNLKGFMVSLFRQLEPLNN